MAALPLPNGKQQFFDNNGVPLNGGSVTFYIPNTTTFKNTYQDEALTILNTNPVVLDSAGRAVIWGAGDFRQIVKDSAGNTIWDQQTSSGSGTSGFTIVRSPRTSNTALAVEDNSTFIEVQNVFTQTFVASATLGNGWSCYIRNDASSAITLQPNGGETIDGASSATVLPTETRLVFCDGTALYSVVIHPGLPSTIKRSPRTSNTVLAYADDSTFIDINALFTQTFSASASLTNGWFVYVRNNNGSGNIMLQPNGVETIDGASSATMLPGEVRLVFTDGTALYSTIVHLSPQATAASVKRSPRSSNTILGVADNSTLIDFTAGPFTQTFSANATLGNGWFVYTRNSSGQPITFQMNAAETIDGVNSFISYPNEARLIVSDGTSCYSIVLQPFYMTYTSSGTFNKSPGYQYFEGMAWSGGASGNLSSAGTAAPGGHGGGSFPFKLLASGLASSETITIGAGGAAISSAGTGNSGGDTSFGNWFTVSGAQAGQWPGSLKVGTRQLRRTAIAPENGSYGFESVYYSSAGSGNNVNGTYAGGYASNGTDAVAGNSLYGGGSGGGVNSSNALTTAGTSQNGGAGGAGATSGAATAGSAPAGGGGGSQGTSSGAGARGELRIWGVI
jgi:hypothetical protein